MNCLCCGKPLKENEKYCWHKACIKRFFGTKDFPEITVDKKALESLIEKDVLNGLTVPGVQKKLSLHLSFKKISPRLTLVDYPTGYILKPQVKDFEHLPEAEHLAMMMGKISGINVVPFALVKNEDEYSYITKRIDRIINGNIVQKIAMEDFCQLNNRLTSDKYKSSYERCAKTIVKHSSQPGIDLTELFMRLVFSFVIGNSDMHLKNFSLIETSDGNYILSPAYDLVPVQVIMPEDKEEFALAFNGKKTNIRKKDFYVFASECGISETSANKMIRKIVSLEDKYIEMIETSFLLDSQKERFIDLLKKRISILK